MVFAIRQIKKILIKKNQNQKFFDLPDTIYKILKNAVNEYHFFKAQ